MSVGVRVQASASSTAQKLPLPGSHNITPGSSVHRPNSSLSIRLKPITPRTPVIQIRQDASNVFSLQCWHLAYTPCTHTVLCLAGILFHGHSEFGLVHTDFCRKTISIVAAILFTARMPFMMPSKQCQSTERRLKMPAPMKLCQYVAI